MEKKTVMQVVDATVRAHGGRPALAEKRGGAYRTFSWREYHELVRLSARGFMKLGLDAKQGVSIIGFNCKEWVIADLAAIFAGGFPAGIYTTSSADQCQYIADHSDSSIVVVEDETQLRKFLSVRDRLPKVRAFILMHGAVPKDVGAGVHTWDEVLELGKSVPDADLDARIAAQKPDDVCTLFYTSGTTGEPKAVMISHDNIVFVADVVKSLVDFTHERFLSYLPLSHIAEQVVCIHGPIACAGCTYFAESMEKLPENLREVRPTVFLGVPRVWEKIQAKMVEAGQKNPPLRKKIAAWARAQGLAGGYADQRKESRPLLYPIADKIVFQKVRAALGLDQCRFAVTSAAPISKATLEFFLSLGIPLMEVYGMSECTGPATLSLPDRYQTGSVGFILPEAELKVAEDGEICMRGRHVFKGYYKNPDATAEALDKDGWLHSGDIGEIGPGGFVRITDRKKDLLITAGGENIAPQVIEGKLRDISAVAHAVVVGDREKHLAALLTIDATKLDEAKAASGSSAASLVEAAECAKLHDWMMRQVEAMNRDLARVQTIKKIKILPGELSIEGGELTPTMKIKRKVVYKKYAAEIRAFYEGSDAN